MVRITAILTALLAFAPAALAADSWTEIFRDWQATCFPDGGCEASTGDQGPTAGGDTLRLIVERTSPESEGWFVAIEFHQAPARPDRAITLTVSDHGQIVLQSDSLKTYRGPYRYYVTDPDSLDALLPALLAGDGVQIDYFDVTNEARTYLLSLSGVSASFLWIEEQMDITGAPRLAIPATGLTEPAPDPAVAIREAGLPEAVRAHHERTSSCEIYGDARLEDLGMAIELLSDTQILYALPCTAHAYNVTYRLYLREIGEIGGIRTLYFADYSESTYWTGTDILFNVTVEGKWLTALYKGRGLGDCGSLGEWSWQEHDYRLEHFSVQEECDGAQPDDWPVVFPVH